MPAGSQANGRARPHLSTEAVAEVCAQDGLRKAREVLDVPSREREIGDEGRHGGSIAPLAAPASWRQAPVGCTLHSRRNARQGLGMPRAGATRGEGATAARSRCGGELPSGGQPVGHPSLKQQRLQLCARQVDGGGVGCGTPADNHHMRADVLQGRERGGWVLAGPMQVLPAEMRRYSACLGRPSARAKLQEQNSCNAQRVFACCGQNALQRFACYVGRLAAAATHASWLLGAAPPLACPQLRSRCRLHHARRCHCHWCRSGTPQHAGGGELPDAAAWQQLLRAHQHVVSK